MPIVGRRIPIMVVPYRWWRWWLGEAEFDAQMITPPTSKEAPYGALWVPSFGRWYLRWLADWWEENSHGGTRWWLRRHGSIPAEITWCVVCSLHLFCVFVRVSSVVSFENTVGFFDALNQFSLENSLGERDEGVKNNCPQRFCRRYLSSYEDTILIQAPLTEKQISSLVSI